MKKLSRKSLVAIALVVAMGATLAIGGTIAYFSDKTETAENVFTIGNVDIELDEPSWNAGEDHILVPGATFDKDPTVTVQPDSQDCWMFVKIDLTRYVPLMQYLYSTEKAAPTDPFIKQSIALTDTFLTGFDNTKWKVMNSSEIEAMVRNHQDGAAWDSSLPLILGYQTSALSAGDEVVVFTGVKFPGDLDQTNASLFFQYANGDPKEGDNELKLNVTAYAIQSEGIDDIDEAYAAMGDLFSNT